MKLIKIIYIKYNRYIFYLRRSKKMNEIERYDVNEEWVHSGIIKAGNFYFINYCVGNIG